MLAVMVSYIEGMQPTNILSLKLELDETYCLSPNIVRVVGVMISHLHMLSTLFLSYFVTT